MSDRFEPTERTRVRRRPQRAAYDKQTVFAILDAGLICHLAYVVDGQPVCTPTVYWREGERLYWHGSASSRMLDAQSQGGPVCLAVSHLDGLVLARSGFTHSVNYRSVMVFGRPAPVTDPAEKRRAADALIERVASGRTREIRPAHDRELEAITVIAMPIEEASAKIRDAGVLDPEADLDAACWAGVVSVLTTVGPVSPDPRVPAGVPLPPGVAAYTRGARLDDVLSAFAARQRAASA
jgi:nitroimidazol reductase NimA-like FMN-containing flavoprotein (pyridoxamine 5'-phosphate oxidase superfamily)